MDYISGTEDAYIREDKNKDNKFTVRVSFHAQSDSSYGLLVDFHLEENGGHSANRLEWFPKSLCDIEKIEAPGKLPEYYLTAPEWILISRKVKYEISNNSNIEKT